MKRLLLILLLAMPAMAQEWAGILSSNRAVDWSNAGVVGGIPDTSAWTQCGATMPSTSTAAQITTRLAGCSANQYVLLGAGTFNLSTGIDIPGHSNVVLRGAGPDQTILAFTNATGCGGWYGTVCVSDSGRQFAYSWTDTQVGGVRSATWSGGYAAGTTSITLSNVGSSGITNGQYIILDEEDDASRTNGFLVCSTGGDCMSEGGPNMRTSNGLKRSRQQFVKVASGCASACSGAGPFNITITPGLYPADWASGKNPGAFWPSAGDSANVGIENLTVDATNALCDSTVSCGVVFLNTVNSWAKNVRTIRATRSHFLIYQSSHVTIRDSYSFGSRSANIMAYGVEAYSAGEWLVENNIFAHMTSPLMLGPSSGGVFAYNYGIDDYVGKTHDFTITGTSLSGNVATYTYTGCTGYGYSCVAGSPFSPQPITVGGTTNGGGIFNVKNAPIKTFSGGASGTFTIDLPHANVGSQAETGTGEAGYLTMAPFIYGGHDSGAMYNLFEGNIGAGINGDAIHGSVESETVFRNYLPGWERGKTAHTQGVRLDAVNHHWNVVGNVMGTSTFHTCYKAYAPFASSPCASGGSPGATNIYNLGEPTSATYSVAEDAYTPASFLAWGNYDTVSGATRWCGNSSSTGWSTTCGSTSEIPTGLTDGHANTVPSTETLPASFYLASKPSWFGATQWPAIGPDVTGGTAIAPDLTEVHTAPGGHAYTTPAEACYYSSTIDSGYPTIFTRGVLAFDAGTCYDGGGPTPQGTKGVRGPAAVRGPGRVR